MDIKKYQTGLAMAACRKRVKLTQPQVADMIGSGGFQSISRYERGQTAPTLYRAIQLADIYGVTLDELVGREVSKKDA